MVIMNTEKTLQRILSAHVRVSRRDDPGLCTLVQVSFRKSYYEIYILISGGNLLVNKLQLTCLTLTVSLCNSE